MAFRFRRKKKDTPNGLWIKCNGCGNPVYKKDVDSRMKVCPQCEFHFPLSTQERIDMLLDEGSFAECYGDMVSTDPLKFSDVKPYPERLAGYESKTGMLDAARMGKGKINGIEIVFVVIDAGFMMGSMGSVVGEKITRATEAALESSLPLVVVSGSGGGARMQEGAFSLMQMAKTSAALAKFHESGGIFISVLTNPTMGGSMASFASLGDIIIAEPKALIGFTGPRVFQQTLKKKLPDGFQTSEFLMEHGFVDRVVNRRDMKEELTRLLSYCTLNGRVPIRSPKNGAEIIGDDNSLPKADPHESNSRVESDSDDAAREAEAGHDYEMSPDSELAHEGDAIPQETAQQQDRNGGEAERDEPREASEHSQG